MTSDFNWALIALENVIEGKSADGKHQLNTTFWFPKNPATRLALAEQLKEIIQKYGRPVDSKFITRLIPKLIHHYTFCCYEEDIPPEEITMTPQHLDGLVKGLKRFPYLVDTEYGISSIRYDEITPSIGEVIIFPNPGREVVWSDGHYKLETTSYRSEYYFSNNIIPLAVLEIDRDTGGAQWPQKGLSGLLNDEEEFFPALCKALYESRDKIGLKYFSESYPPRNFPAQEHVHTAQTLLGKDGKWYQPSIESLKIAIAGTCCIGSKTSPDLLSAILASTVLAGIYRDRTNPITQDQLNRIGEVESDLSLGDGETLINLPNLHRAGRNIDLYAPLVNIPKLTDIGGEVHVNIGYIPSKDDDTIKITMPRSIQNQLKVTDGNLNPIIPVITYSDTSDR